MSEETIRCDACGAEVPKEESYYGEEGEQLCRACEADQSVAKGFRKGYVSRATGAVSLALLSLCFNPFALTSFAAIVGAVYTFTYPSNLAEEDKDSIEGLWWLQILAGLALLLALVTGLAAIFRWLGIGFSMLA